MREFEIKETHKRVSNELLLVKQNILLMYYRVWIILVIAKFLFRGYTCKNTLWQVLWHRCWNVFLELSDRFTNKVTRVEYKQF